MKATKFEKKSPACFDKTAVFTQYRQNKCKWEIFLSFVAFSEKLDFKWLQNKKLFLTSNHQDQQVKVSASLVFSGSATIKSFKWK